LSIHSFNHAVYAQGRYGNELDNNIIVSLTSKRGVLYNGIDNILKLNQPLDSVIKYTFLMQTNNGYITKDTGTYYLCIPQRTGELRLTLFKIAAYDTIMIGYRFFLVENIPDPLLTINSRPISTPITLPKMALLNCDSLGVFFSEDIPGSDGWMTITEFTIGYSYGGFYVSHTNLTNKLTDKTKALIRVC